MFCFTSCLQPRKDWWGTCRLGAVLDATDTTQTIKGSIQEMETGARAPGEAQGHCMGIQGWGLGS